MEEMRWRGGGGVREGVRECDRSNREMAGWSEGEERRSSEDEEKKEKKKKKKKK